MLVILGIAAIVAVCLGGVAWIDYHQSKKSVRRTGRSFSSGAQLQSARRSARVARNRAHSRLRYR